MWLFWRFAAFIHWGSVDWELLKIYSNGLREVVISYLRCWWDVDYGGLCVRLKPTWPPYSAKPVYISDPGRHPHPGWASEHMAMKILFMFSPGKELRGLSPNFHIHVCLWAIYIYPGSVHILSCSCIRIGRLILEIYQSLTDIWV
jgi:hypothetical protein